MIETRDNGFNCFAISGNRGFIKMSSKTVQQKYFYLHYLNGNNHILVLSSHKTAFILLSERDVFAVGLENQTQ